MKWFRYLVILLLTHCGGDPVVVVPTTPIQPVVVAPAPPKAPSPIVSPTGICYSSNNVSISNRRIYEEFLYNSFAGRCCRTGKQTTIGSINYNICGLQTTCKDMSGKPAFIRFSVTPNYQSIEYLSLGLQTQQGKVIQNMRIEPINKSRGWLARGYVPSAYPGGIGGDLVLECEECDFEDTKYKMDIIIKYQNQNMGNVIIYPYRPSTSEQCTFNIAAS